MRKVKPLFEKINLTNQIFSLEMIWELEIVQLNVQSFAVRICLPKPIQKARIANAASTRNAKYVRIRSTDLGYSGFPWSWHVVRACREQSSQSTAGLGFG